MNIHMWLLFVVAYMAMTLSPGPNVLIVLSHASKYGLRHIVTTLFANLTCQLLIIALVGFGVGAMLTSDTSLYHWVKVIGALYLIFLGLKSLYAAFIKSHVASLGDLKLSSKTLVVAPFYKRYAEAFAVSASNPKTIIFFSAFLRQFVTSEHSILLQFFIMYLSIAVIVIMIHTFYAYILIKMKGKFNNRISGKVMPGVSGLIYIFLGVNLGITK